MAPIHLPKLQFKTCELATTSWYYISLPPLVKRPQCMSDLHPVKLNEVQLRLVIPGFNDSSTRSLNGSINGCMMVGVVATTFLQSFRISVRLCMVEKKQMNTKWHPSGKIINTGYPKHSYVKQIWQHSKLVNCNYIFFSDSFDQVFVQICAQF